MQGQEHNSAKPENGVMGFIRRLPTKPVLDFAPVEVKPVGDSPSLIILHLHQPCLISVAPDL